jgi:hypothetical protein
LLGRSERAGWAAQSKYEVYLAPFPKGQGKWQVSNGNATAPAWRRDGKELYYLTVGGELFATDIGEQGNERRLGRRDCCSG